MKRLEKYKKLARAAWQALGDKEISEAQQAKDIEAFSEFFDKVLMFFYIIFGIFSFISLSLFTTRVIF